MDSNKRQLLACAAMLSQLGEEVERARLYVALLRDMGVRADTNAMRQAIHDYHEAKTLFDATEAQYLALRDHLTGI